MPGKAGQAFRFDGVDDYVVVPDSPLLSPHAATNGEMSVMAWVLITNYPATKPLLAKGSANAWEYALYITQAGEVQFSLWNLNGATYGTALGGHVNLGQWHHLTGTMKKGEHVRMYLDGSLVGASTNFSGNTSDGTSPLYFGRRGDGQFFNGAVDEVALFNRALSSNEVAAVYAAGSAGKCFTNDPAPIFLTHPAGQTTVEQRTATLSGFAMGVPRPDYQWLFNGSPLPNATNNNLILTNLTPSQSGDYALIATNGSGSKTSAIAQIVVLVDYNLTNRVATNCLPRPAGLAAWWPGDGVAVDIVGTNHGTALNGATFEAGKAGPAFKLDGVDDYVIVSHAAIFNLTNSVTMEAWIKSSNSAAYSGIIKKYTTDNKGYQMLVNNDGTIRADFGIGSTYFTASHSKNILDGTWHHAAATYDGTNAFIYVDGFRGSATTRTNLLAVNTASLLIGRDDCCSGRYFNGVIDEASLYSRALSAEEITALYAAGSAGKCYTNDPAPVFLLNPISQTGYTAIPLILSGLAMGVPRPTSQWLFNGDPLVGATNNALQLSYPTTNQSGNYSLLTSNQFGAKTSTVAQITIQPFVLFTTNTTISSGNTNYENQDIVIFNAVVTIDGPHSFHSLQLTNGGMLTHSSGATNGLNLVVTGNILVASNSSISVIGRGYGSDSGPGAGQAEGGLINHSGGGAGHGGLGGTSQSGRAGGQIYGSIFTPVSLGSGGGTGGGW